MEYCSKCSWYGTSLNKNGLCPECGSIPLTHQTVENIAIDIIEGAIRTQNEFEALKNESIINIARHQMDVAGVSNEVRIAVEQIFQRNHKQSIGS